MRSHSEWTGSTATWHKHGAWRGGRGPDDPPPPLSGAAAVPIDPKWKWRRVNACAFVVANPGGEPEKIRFPWMRAA